MVSGVVLQNGCEEPYEPEAEVYHNEHVVKEGVVGDLLSEAELSLVPASQQPSIHIQIPCVAVDSAYELHAEPGPIPALIPGVLVHHDSKTCTHNPSGIFGRVVEVRNHTAVLVAADALHEAPPVRNYREDVANRDLGCSAVAEVRGMLVDTVVAEAGHRDRVDEDWLGRGEHVCEEEVSEFDLAKGRDEHLPEGFGGLDAETAVQLIEGPEDHKEEADRHGDHGPL